MSQVIIEPVGDPRRGRAGRARTLAAVATPLILLIAVVATGALARDERDGSDPRVQADARVVASGRPGAPATDTVGASRDPAAATTPAIADIPSRALGLPARSVEATLEARLENRVGDGLVAIGGYLTVRPTLDECVREGVEPSGPRPAGGWLCERQSILADAPEPLLAIEDGRVRWLGSNGEPHLHPVIFPGVSLGPLDPAVDVTLGGASPDAAMVLGGPIAPVPVIVIGRFDDPRVADRRTNSRHVNQGFVIERLAWADGRPQDRRLARAVPHESDDLDVRTARAIAAEALPGGTVILSQTVVLAETLARLDPSAIAAVGSDVDEEDRLWYVRAMTRAEAPIESLAEDGGPRRLGWLVLSDDGTILASQPDG